MIRNRDRKSNIDGLELAFASDITLQCAIVSFPSFSNPRSRTKNAEWTNQAEPLSASPQLWTSLTHFPNPHHDHPRSRPDQSPGSVAPATIPANPLAGLLNHQYQPRRASSAMVRRSQHHKLHRTELTPTHPGPPSKHKQPSSQITSSASPNTSPPTTTSSPPSSPTQDPTTRATPKPAPSSSSCARSSTPSTKTGSRVAARPAQRNCPPRRRVKKTRHRTPVLQRHPPKIY